MFTGNFLYMLVVLPVGMIVGVIVGGVSAVAYGVTVRRNSPAVEGLAIGAVSFAVQSALAGGLLSTGIVSGMSGMGGVALTAPITGVIFGLYAFWRSRNAAFSGGESSSD